MTTFQNASGSYFEITDTGASSRNITPYVKSVEGLPGPRNLDDATALGDAGRKHWPGLEDGTVRLTLMWSKDALVGPDTIFGPLRTHTAAVAFAYGPEGSTGGDIKYSGTCWVENYEAPARVGSLIEAIVTLRVQGTVTRGTF